MKPVAPYSTQYEGWNVKHFHSWYRREHQGRRSYTWVKNGLQAAGAVAKAPRRGAHTESAGNVRRWRGLRSSEDDAV
jgi:hypothetical protein